MTQPIDRRQMHVGTAFLAAMIAVKRDSLENSAPQTAIKGDRARWRPAGLT